MSLLSHSKRSKTSVTDGKIPCIIPHCDGQHWRAFLTDSERTTIRFFDFLGSQIDWITSAAIAACCGG